MGLHRVRHDWATKYTAEPLDQYIFVQWMNDFTIPKIRQAKKKFGFYKVAHNHIHKQ